MVYEWIMEHPTSTAAPTILFGAFDRHNFGDLLFPHIAAALLQTDDVVFAGLAERDLRRYGGHQVRPLAQLAAEFGASPVNLIHVGGELLTCNAWQAAVMLSPPDEAQQAIRYFEHRPEERAAWVGRALGVPSLAPYTASRRLFPQAATVIYNAVGGVDLDARDEALRAEVLANLKAADDVSVRDGRTLALLNAAGVAARLVPDPAVMVAELFGDRIGRHARQDEPGEIQAAFPQGYVAVQFSADFGDDQTLTEIAGQLDHVAASTGHGIVLFRAGAAPWHDDLACYRRLVGRMRTKPLAIFESLDLWDICALISRCRAYCGSSLHGRIVAGAYALPRVSLLPPSQANGPSKQAAYAATWELPDLPATVDVRGLAQGVEQALAVDKRRLRRLAGEMAVRYRSGFAAGSPKRR